jgi:hypothetical protein
MVHLLQRKVAFRYLNVKVNDSGVMGTVTSHLQGQGDTLFADLLRSSACLEPVDDTLPA